MGLAKKLGSVNTATSQQLSGAHASVADAGYNHNNIPSIPILPQMSTSEIQDVRQVTLSAQEDVNRIRSSLNTLGLVKPTIPSGRDYPNSEISSLIVEKMWRIVCLKNLFAFYTQHQLQELVNRACRHDYRTLQREWNLPTLDMTADLAVLGLYDIVVFADDSGSMKDLEPNEDNMSRFDILNQVLKTVGFWSCLMDSDGIVLRFFNSLEEGNGLSTMTSVDKIMKKVKPNGFTPMGEEMKNKILNKIVYPIMNSNGLNRPVLIITLTDGIPQNERIVIETIVECKNACSRTKYGENAVAFSFAQIGSDVGATEFLGKLDVHPVVGHLIDCTSEYSIERQQCGPAFTEAVWVVKLMIGAVDPAYDASDEQPQNSQPQPPQYQQQPVYQPYQTQQYVAQPQWPAPPQYPGQFQPQYPTQTYPGPSAPQWI